MSGEERTVLFQLPTMISGQLICTQGTLAGRSWNLSAGTFVIGRAPGSDLTLATEPGVSKLHAKILAEGGTYAIVDNESRNGTIVNGRPVQKAQLKTGDQIRICNCVLRFTQTGGGFGLSSMEAPPTSAGEPDFDGAAGTSPELSEMTAAGGPPPSMEPPPSFAAPPPTPAGPAGASFVAPTPSLPATPGYPTSGVELPRPAPEVRVQSALPWFAIGLLAVVVVGAGGWGGLRFFGDALLGPMPSALAADADDVTADPNDAIARERAAEAKAARAAAGDAGAAAADDVKLASAGDPVADDGAAKTDPLADDAAADDGAAAGDPAADDPAADDPAADDTVAAADPAADSALDDDSEPRLDDTDSKASAATGRRPPRAKTTEDDDDGAKPASGSTGPSSWYAVVIEREGPIAVKARAGGTVADVAASDGQSVRRGALLFSFEDAGSDEISNLRANIEALEAVAESQPSAQEMLDREKDKLKRLLAKSGDVNVTAPASGTLTGFAVKVGDTLKGGDSVGTIERGGVTLLVNVSGSDGRRIRRGGSVELKTKSGSASGRVSSVRRRGGGYQVTISTDAAPDDLSEARFP